MMILITAALAASSATSAMQPVAAAAPAAHAQHAQHGQPAQKAQSGTKAEGKDCCCKAMAEGGKMACCAKHGESHGGEHADHDAKR